MHRHIDRHSEKDVNPTSRYLTGFSKTALLAGVGFPYIAQALRDIVYEPVWYTHIGSRHHICQKYNATTILDPSNLRKKLRKLGHWISDITNRNFLNRIWNRIVDKISDQILNLNPSTRKCSCSPCTPCTGKVWLPTREPEAKEPGYQGGRRWLVIDQHKDCVQDQDISRHHYYLIYI